MQQVQMLSYISEISSTIQDRAEALRHIQTQSQAQNATLGVSGILLLRGTIFLHVLEGPPVVVKNIFNRIQSDARHGAVNVLINEPSDMRHFGSGPMAYFHDDAQDYDLLSAFHQIGAYLGQSATQGLGYTPSGLARCARHMVGGLVALHPMAQTEQVEYA